MLRVNKISWSRVMEELKNGVAFLGSTNESIPDKKFIDMLGMEFYVDRKYKSGVTTLQLNVLDRDKNIIGVSNIDKKGSCFLIEGKFIQIKTKGFTLYYAIV